MAGMPLRPTSSRSRDPGCVKFQAAVNNLFHMHETEVASLREEVRRLQEELAVAKSSKEQDMVTAREFRDSLAASSIKVTADLDDVSDSMVMKPSVQSQMKPSPSNSSLKSPHSPALAGVTPGDGQSPSGMMRSRQTSPSELELQTSEVRSRSVVAANAVVSEQTSGSMEDSMDPLDQMASAVPKTGMDWVMGTPIDIGAASLIVFNTIFMLIHSQWIGYTNRVYLGLEAPGAWEHAEEAFDLCEYIFTVAFFIELIMRLGWFGFKFLKDPLNMLDAIVVFTTTLDTFVLSRFDIKAGVSAIRLIRMVKLAKTFRFARAMKQFEPLRILIRTIAGSVLSLFWSMVILIMFMMVAAILTAQTLQTFVIDDSADINHRLWVDEHYGDAWKALWTMFEITLSGGWPNWVTPLVRHVSVLWGFFFGIYVCVVVFAVIRVITALFLKATLAEAAKDEKAVVQDKMKSRAQMIAKIQEVFHNIDRNSDGLLFEDEFYRALKDEKIGQMFVALDMEPKQLSQVFHILDDGDGEVSLDEFLEGIMRMKGSSRETDVLHLMHDSAKMMRSMKIIEQTLSVGVRGAGEPLGAPFAGMGVANV